jgi:lipopolysaccharide/colanic/teichoic acid biosynthesis glycosyltransferase
MAESNLLTKAYRHGGKRLVDLIGAGLASIVLAPLVLVIAIMVRLSIGAPVFFRQQRAGLRGESFTIVKFRTMTNSCEAHGRLLPDALRLTRWGRFLRSTSLDELPELINVLKGEMSLVGPRPLFSKYLGRYTLEQMRRHEVKPGITGWAQVNGRNALTWEQKFGLDVWYVDHQSLWIDLKVIVLTILRTIKREGISAPGQATAQEFMGSLNKTE